MERRKRKRMERKKSAREEIYLKEKVESNSNKDLRRKGR